MNYIILGSEIEYLQTAKRLEQIIHAAPATPEAQERKELIMAIVKFEKEINKLKKQE